MNNQVGAFDSYLEHLVRTDRASKPRVRGTDEDSESPILDEKFAASSGFPVLLRVASSEWTSDANGFEEQVRLGDVITGYANRRGLDALRRDPGVLSVEASRNADAYELVDSVPSVKATPVHLPPFSEEGDRALIAFVDSGIDLLHKAFQDDRNKSRVVAIWDQWDSKGTPPPGFKYGTYHDEKAIGRYLRTGKVPQGLGRDPDLHGTHVASIAAGRRSGAFGGGVAPSAKIIVVKSKVDASPGDPQSIGYSKSHVDALKFIDGIASLHDMPVVVNVSQGMNAGSHDGSSALEAAFDNFSGGGRAPGRVVVKSAGNEHGENGHVSLSVGSSGIYSLEWFADASVSRDEDYFEIWFSSSDSLSFALLGPSGDRSGRVSEARAASYGRYSSGNDYHLSITRYHPDNGDSRVVVTVRKGAGSTIESGIWRLEIKTGMVRSSGILHAWVERRRGRPVRFRNHRSDQITLSIPGTARTVISVGAVETPKGPQLRLLDFSSHGPTRDLRQKPDMVAPGSGIQAALAGTIDGVTGMRGTSMAAPHVSGAIALLFSQHKKSGVGAPLNAAQIRAAITQLSQCFTGRWDSGRGYGFLDVSALLDENW